MRVRVVREGRDGSRFDLKGLPMPASLRVIARRIMEPRVLFVLGLLLFGAAAVGLHFYSELSREIDSRLKAGFLDNSVGLFTSPFPVAAGDRLSKEELLGYLRAAGYQQDAAGPDGATGSFTVDGQTVDIRPGREASVKLSLRPVSIEVAGGTVKAVRDPDTKREIKSAEIEGGLLAAVQGGSRSKKSNLTFGEIPENLKHAVLAVEDRRFFDHLGIDWRGIARALYIDLSEGQLVQGGSTITQQLIKNSFLSSDRTLSRKIKEAAMAVILESRLSKEEIFTAYCNDVYLGQSGTYAVNGFAEAARVYFDKEVSELTLSESAYLAGLIHAPNRYAGARNLGRATERRNTVLDSMVATGAISEAEAEAAKSDALQIKKQKGQDDYGATYFIDYAQRYAEEKYGEAVAQKRIYTSMDPRLQKAAFEAVASQLGALDRVAARGARKGEAAPPVQAALVALDARTGEVLAMVGGRNYDESQLNRATDARRQPGSTFKPFIYAAALNMRSFTAATLVSDRGQEFSYDGGRRTYKPTNFGGGSSNRDVTLREALNRSLNVPTVELAMRVGLGNIAQVAENSGLERPPLYPSMALGTGEVTPLALAGAYTAFANEGMALRPTPIKTVQGPADGAAAGRVSAKAVRVFSPQVAYIMTNMMQSVVDSGTASRIRAMGLTGAMAGKTGTSNDGWFVGYTPRMVCAVWVGFDDNHDMRLKASDSALPIWASFVKEALEIRPSLGGQSFARPGGIVTEEIDPATGLVASEACPERRQEVFISGTQPFATCAHELGGDDYLAADFTDAALMSVSAEGEESDYDHITLDICAETGSLASSACPSTAQKRFKLGREPLAICKGESHREAAPAEPPTHDVVFPNEQGGRKANRGGASGPPARALPPIPRGDGGRQER